MSMTAEDVIMTKSPTELNYVKLDNVLISSTVWQKD